MKVFNEQYIQGCCILPECMVAVGASLSDSPGVLSIVDSSFSNCEYRVDIYASGAIHPVLVRLHLTTSPLAATK